MLTVKFQVGDKVRVKEHIVRDSNKINTLPVGYIGVITRIDTFPNGSYADLGDIWHWAYLDALELVEEENRYEPCEKEGSGIEVNYLSNKFEISQDYIYKEIKNAEVANKTYLTLGKLYGYNVWLSKKEPEQQIKKFDFSEELLEVKKYYSCDWVVDYKPKNNIMSKITTFAKNLVLSADEKLLRKYGLKDECGEFTDEAEDLVIAKLVKENESYLIELAKGMEEEEKNK